MKTELGKDKERRVVGICADNDQLFALCDDGSMWALDTLDLVGGSEWKEVPELP
jgi:hypothetical protein